MDRKKIFIVTNYPSLELPTYYSWVKTRVESLVELYDIVVIQIDSSKDSIGYSRVQLDGYSLYTLSIKAPKIPKVKIFFEEFHIRRMLTRIVEEERPHLFHVHFSSYYSWIVHSISRKYDIPFCITEHATFFEESMRRPYAGPRMRRALEAADRVYAVSHSLKNVMQNYVDREITVKFNVVDPKRFSLCETWNQSNLRHETSFVSVGSLDTNDKKGYELLIQSVFELKQRRPDTSLRCDIIGTGPNHSKLASMISKYGLEKSVFLLGNVANDRIVNNLQKADFYVSSSRKETFGVAVVEAMYCGLPIVATASGGPEEFITENCGIICEPTVSSISEAIERMHEKQRGFDRAGIRAYVMSRFSPPIYLDYMQNAYKDILQASIARNGRE